MKCIPYWVALISLVGASNAHPPFRRGQEVKLTENACCVNQIDPAHSTVKQSNA